MNKREELKAYLKVVDEGMKAGQSYGFDTVIRIKLLSMQASTEAIREELDNKKKQNI